MIQLKLDHHGKPGSSGWPFLPLVGLLSSEHSQSRSPRDSNPDDENINIVAHFLTFLGKQAYSLLKVLASLEKPISLLYTTLKELLLDYAKYTNFECSEGRFRKMIHDDMKNSTTLRHPIPVHTQGYADNSLRSCNAVHEDGHKFGQCLSCGRFHSFNSCKFYNSKCFKCGGIGHIHSICNSDPNNLESYSSSELNKTQNRSETTISNQSTYQISHVIVPDMIFPNDSHISDEISYKSEENISDEPNHDRKTDVVLIDADFSNDPLLCNDIPNKFEETISEESNLDVISNILCPHDAFVSCEKLVRCEARVLNELEFDYNSDNSISTVVCPYHKFTSNVYSSQIEKDVLNKTTLFITCGYEDPTLFRGGG
ncbi:unnamed protein product [Schistosoma spindalis]|nr:unnamed protein product [Schistosoma spindale]